MSSTRALIVANAAGRQLWHLIDRHHGRRQRGPWFEAFQPRPVDPPPDVLLAVLSVGG